MFQPLTKEQYQKAIDAGFSPQQIVQNEQIRKSKETPKDQGFWGNMVSGLKNTFGMGEKSQAPQNIAGVSGVVQDVAKGIGGIGQAMNPVNQATGMVREGASIFGNLAKGAEGLFGQTQDPASATAKKWGDVTPNAGQGIGKFVTQTGVYGGIGAGVGAIAEGAGAGSGLLSRIGQGATVGGLGTAAITGDPKQAEMGAILGGAIPLIGAGIGKVAPAIGKRIMQSIIKPTAADVADGFKIDTISKYDLGGSLQDTATKTHNMITDLASQLKTKLAGSNANVDVLGVLAKTEEQMSGNEVSTFGANASIKKIFSNFTDELGTMSKDGVFDLSDSTQILRSTGRMGSWTYGKYDPDSTALEKVATTFYKNLTSAINKSAPAEVAGIKTQLSELIPVESALIRRIPIAERASMIGMSDVLTAIPGVMHPANWWLFALNRLAKSGGVASALMKTENPTSTIGKFVLGK